MNIQGISLGTQSANVFGNARKAADENGEDKSGAVNISFVKTQQKYIASLQEKITEIRNDEELDSETKKSKIAELENMIIEAEKAMLAEAAKEKEEARKKEEEELKKSLSVYDAESQDGDTFKLSKQSQLLLQAGTNLDDLRNTYDTKKVLEAERRRLSAELETDKERGLSGSGYKAGKIGKLDGVIAGAQQAFTEAIESGNETAQELSETDSAEKDKAEEENKDNKSNFAAE